MCNALPADLRPNRKNAARFARAASRFHQEYIEAAIELERLRLPDGVTALTCCGRNFDVIGPLIRPICFVLQRYYLP